tara:strand:+ start:32 stop:1447 length:1416 start_codon:yes stop_codon:yes gene_type:complete
MDFLKDVFGSGMNIWGASAPQNTQRMIDAGLLAPDAGEKAQSQSLMRGLLGAGVSYLSQPKNQNYGSALPYIGKALGQGMEQAQKPMDNMYDRAKQNHAMNQISEAKLAKENKSKFESGMFQNNSTIKGLERQADPRLERKDQAGNITQVAPNFNPIQTTETPTWDSEKYLQDSLNSKLINSEEYFKYKNLMNPKDEGFTLAADGKRYDSKGRLIASNPKEQQEKLSNDYRVWLEMGGSNSKYKTFPSYIDSQDSGIQITNQMPGGADGTSRAIQDDYDKVFIQSQNDGAALNAQLGDLQQMERLISKAGETGAGAGALLGLQKIGKRLGINTEGMSTMEAMQALSNKLALGMKKAGTGVMTDRDFQTFLESVPSIGNTPEGNKMILDWTRDSHKRTMKLAEILDDYKSSTKSIYGTDKPAGAVDGGIYKVIRNYWAGVRKEREQTFFKEDGLDPSGNAGPGAFEVVREKD